jgi:hypothetical protein
MATLKTYALTTLADVKESLGIPSSNTTLDNLIIRKINQATAAIESYCGRRFKSTVYTDELYNATQGDQLVLKQRPIIGDVVLKVRDGTESNDDFETVDSSLVFADANSGVLDLNFNALGHWGRYAVTYTAGYATIPDDLAEACASLAAYYVNNSDASGVGVSSKQEGQRKVSYASTGQSFRSVADYLGIDTTLDTYTNTPLFADK